MTDKPDQIVRDVYKAWRYIDPAHIDRMLRDLTAAGFAIVPLVAPLPVTATQETPDYRGMRLTRITLRIPEHHRGAEFNAPSGMPINDVAEILARAATNGIVDQLKPDIVRALKEPR